jgi:hypothetical protein
MLDYRNTGPKAQGQTQPYFEIQIFIWYKKITYRHPYEGSVTVTSDYV